MDFVAFVVYNRVQHILTLGIKSEKKVFEVFCFLFVIIQIGTSKSKT